MTEKKSGRIFLICNGILLLMLAALPLWKLFVGAMPRWMSGCLLHDRFFLYCPVCGGTRAVDSLLRLDLFSAFAFNPFVSACILALLAVDIVAWARFFQKKRPLFPVPAWVWICLAASMLLYGVLRNYLMIAHGIDPTGDLVGFWNAVMKR